MKPGETIFSARSTASVEVAGTGPAIDRPGATRSGFGKAVVRAAEAGPLGDDVVRGPVGALGVRRADRDHERVVAGSRLDAVGAGVARRCDDRRAIRPRASRLHGSVGHA